MKTLSFFKGRVFKKTYIQLFIDIAVMPLLQKKGLLHFHADDVLKFNDIGVSF